jgi:RND family efflux transporter MFP subunit
VTIDNPNPHGPHPDEHAAMRDTGAEYLSPRPALQSETTPSAPQSPGSRRYGGLIFGIVLCVLLGFLVVRGIHSRAVSEHGLQASADNSAVPVVRVTVPMEGAGSATVSLPANVTAYVDTPIYARTSGYLKQWFYDIGAHVQKGALLAIIASPEVDQQVLQAESDVNTADSNLKLAQITANRWEKLLQKNAVSHQEADQAVSDLSSKQSALAAQQANVERLKQMQGFERIYAPFSGIVTARNVDTGSLIAAGQNTAQKELFHLASAARLRVFVPVPEVYQSAVRDGERIPLTVDAYPNQTFWGTLVRNASAVDPASRTLTVEVDVDNAAGKLLPGTFAFVHLPLPQGAAGLRIPSNALLFRSQGMQVGIVENGHVMLRDVAIGHDYGATVEITHGISPTDRIVLDPSDSLESGDAVRVFGDPSASSGKRAAE